jgi:hypothetical protein
LVILVNTPVISPIPEDGNNGITDALSLLQLKIVPLTVPDGCINEMASPEQIVCVCMLVVTSGSGFTVTVTVIGVPVHVFPALV